VLLLLLLLLQLLPSSVTSRAAGATDWLQQLSAAKRGHAVSHAAKP